MFVFNFKVNKNLLFKIIFVILFVCVLVIALTGTYKTFFANKTDTCTNKGKINVISSANYTNNCSNIRALCQQNCTIFSAIIKTVKESK